MKCLIIAAGTGSRMREQGESKPLLPVLGVPLIERVVCAAQEGGATSFHVVTGYNGPRVRFFLDDLARRRHLEIHHLINPDWQKPNGLSVLQAEAALEGPFFLLMADHLFDPQILTQMQKCPPAADEVTLAVDYNLRNEHIDLDDVTRVKCQDERLLRIGKNLDDYNAFDTGIFYCTPAIFGAIHTSVDDDGDASLSGGMRVLIASGRARCFDIARRFWIDVDDPPAAEKARRYLRELGVHQDGVNLGLR